MSPGFLLFVAIMAAIVFLLASMYFERRRTLKWEEVAGRNGFSFTASAPLPSWPFDLLYRGHSKRNRNAVGWDAGGYRITLSDYSYVTGSGRSRQTHRQTICLLEDPKVSIPPFSLRREHGLFDAIGSSLGMQDIDVPGDEAFSKAFVVKGNETGVLECFNSDIRTFLLGARGTFSAVEGRSGAVLVNFGRRIDPERYGEYAGFGMELFTRFRTVCARTW